MWWLLKEPFVCCFELYGDVNLWLIFFTFGVDFWHLLFIDGIIFHAVKHIRDAASHK